MSLPPPRSIPLSAHDAPPTRTRLLIEGEDPAFPLVYRRNLRRCTGADIALTRLRIATLRLRKRDVDHLVRLRLLLAELTTSAWEVETHRALLDPRRAPMLRILIALLESGRLEFRAAPLAAWAPDFTVFHGSEGPRRAVIGPHWLESSPGQGPRFGAVVSGIEARRVGERFDRIWRRAYDVGPAIARLLGGTLAAVDRLTPPSRSGIVPALQKLECLPP
ncbi:MAG: hypothetical protein KJO11_08480 [Gemmatimonadetes bacterium]|nr:hypothetical protein [Gemmatimonadota bacterium]